MPSLKIAELINGSEECDGYGLHMVYNNSLKELGIIGFTWLQNTRYFQRLFNVCSDTLM